MAGYGSDAEFSAWLDSQGLTLPSPPPVGLGALRQRGSDYVDSTYEPRLQCSERAGGWDQERAWPRTGHRGVTGIPKPWVLASFRAAWLEGNNPGWASGSIDPNRRTKREKAGEVEREYFAAGDLAGAAPGTGGNVDAVIAGMVAPFLCAGRGIGFMVV